jgi:glycosyltransferase involved in cell wall biosynthesis
MSTVRLEAMSRGKGPTHDAEATRIERDRDLITPRREGSIVLVGPDPCRAVSVGGHVTDVAVLREQLEALGFESTVVPESPRDLAATTLPRKVLRTARRTWSSLEVCRRSRPCFVVLLAGPPASFLEKALIAGLLRAIGCRTLLCPRSGYLEPAVSRSPVWRRVLTAAARLPDVIVVQSQTWKDFFTGSLGVASDRVHVVANWIASANLPTRPPSAEPGQVRFVYAAPFSRDKGIDDLLGTLPGFASNLTSQGATFTFVGDGPERDRVRALAEGAGPAIRYLPELPRSEFLAFLASQDVLVVPSRVEGLPNLVAEAMSMGLVVVATSVGGLPDAIRPGHNGCLYEPGDVRRLTEILTELLMNPGDRHRLAATARTTARGQFSAERNVRRLADLGCPRRPADPRRAGGSYRGDA